MVYEIVFKKHFVTKLQKVFDYINGELGILIAQKFAQELEKKFDLLSEQPFVGRRSSTFNQIRSISAGKQKQDLL
ncbi:MAG TPA: type II toxin-antitoxin system RelE/ParE family toxin [Parafilimonas sp.]